MANDPYVFPERRWGRFWRGLVLPLFRPWCWMRGHQRVSDGRERYCYICLKVLPL